MCSICLLSTDVTEENREDLWRACLRPENRTGTSRIKALCRYSLYRSANPLGSKLCHHFPLLVRVMATRGQVQVTLVFSVGRLNLH
jgi:hypothetical protein